MYLVLTFRTSHPSSRPSGQIVNPLKRSTPAQSSILKSSNTQISKHLPTRGPIGGVSIQKSGSAVAAHISNSGLEQRLANNRKRLGGNPLTSNSSKTPRSTNNVLATGEM